MADPNPLQEGEPIDGYQASLPAGVKARFWRYHLHDETWLFGCGLLLVAPVIGLVAIWLGSFLFATRRIKTLMLGLVICAAGGLVILGGLLLGVLGIWGAFYWKKRFPNMLLIPGVIISSKPLRIVGLADLGKSDERKGMEFGLRFSEPWHLPSHSHEVGTRIPCVANFSDDGIDRYYFFSPHPIAYATGDEFDLEQCMARLGEASFQRLERLVARGTVPDHEQWMLVVDRNDEVIENRGSVPAGEMSRAAKEAQARASEASPS